MSIIYQHCFTFFTWILKKLYQIHVLDFTFVFYNKCVLKTLK